MIRWQMIRSGHRRTVSTLHQGDVDETGRHRGTAWRPSTWLHRIGCCGTVRGGRRNIRRKRRCAKHELYNTLTSSPAFSLFGVDQIFILYVVWSWSSLYTPASFMYFYITSLFHNPFHVFISIIFLFISLQMSQQFSHSLAMCPLVRTHFLGGRASSGHNNWFSTVDFFIFLFFFRITIHIKMLRSRVAPE